jgi:hypothetical protein
MDTRWVSHLGNDPEKKEELLRTIKGSGRTLQRLVEILTKDLEQSKKDQRKADHYDSPNWMLIQADANATQRTLEKIINLCKV